MKQSCMLTVLLYVVLWGSASLSAQEEYEERWDRCVFIATIKDKEEGGEKKVDTNFGSGFIIKKGEQLFLVTARHVSDETTMFTRVFYRMRNGASRWLAIAKMVPQLNYVFEPNDKDGKPKELNAFNPWVTHAQTDLAYFEIKIEEKNEPALAEFKAMAIPVENIVKEPVARLTSIEITGFPMALGTQADVSANVIKAYVVNREVPQQTKWGPSKFIFASPPTGNGNSGGPVFLPPENGNIKDVRLLGIYTGYLKDETGSKLAQIVPARMILEMLK